MISRECVDASCEPATLPAMSAMGAEVSLASWNVFQGLRYPPPAHSWAPNKDLIPSIASLDADVIVLPELWRYRRPEVTLAEDVATALGYELHEWTSERPSRVGDVGVWRLGVLTRVPARTLDPLVMPELGPFGRRAAVRVHLTESDLTLAAAHLLGIHLLFERSPREWMKERCLLREIAAGHDIIAGDLNMWTPIVRRDARNLRPAIRGRTYPSIRPHSQIDHILVSDRIEVLDGERLPDQGSDHRALRVTLRTREV